MLQDLTIDQALLLAQNGDERIREELIENHKAFIIKTSSNICKRYLTWGNDDELSIALVAFNEAIDSYNGEASFYSFAKTVISRRLIDYFRKESKHQTLSLTPLEDNNELCDYDSIKSFEIYKEKQREYDLSDTVGNFVIVLMNYGITLEDLAKASPKHRDTKETLYRVAQELCSHQNLLEYLYKNKQLPLKELELLTGVKRKTLERARKYLIATALIQSNPDLVALKDFTQLA
ncbi:RNA polymerase sigma-I factor [Desulfitobacterium hafniense]|uniref:RNA polymerase sigma factor SigI n=1 Tax=Desulfitobacterium hafniense TaxID=49338 RepID=A0A098B8U5_DESHA|nr:RNA polymerase sigma-I factor [Desulfitobacterium hafniense]CDX04780.1 spore_sigI: RNA polymerase sigma-I factor [Desulfitobacterium hafniense]